MRKIEGSNYGIHGVALYDPVFLFLHRFIVRIQRENPKKTEDLMKSIKEARIQAKIRDLLCGLSSKSDVSPRGLISLLMVLYDMVSIAIWD